MRLKNCHIFFWGVGVQVSFQPATTYHSNLGKALLLDPMGMEMIYNTMLKTAYVNFGYVFRWMASACWASPCVTCFIAHIALYIAVSQFLGNWKESQGGQWRIGVLVQWEVLAIILTHFAVVWKRIIQSHDCLVSSTHGQGTWKKHPSPVRENQAMSRHDLFEDAASEGEPQEGALIGLFVLSQDKDIQRLCS